MRLEHNVSVGEDHGPGELVQAPHCVECTRIDTFGERVLDEIRRSLEQVRFVRVCGAQALERAEIVGVAKRGSALFEDRPVALGPALTELRGKMPMKIGLDGVLDALITAPLVGGSSLIASKISLLIVYTYLWLPFMILPVEAALERVPASYLEASGDLGARPWLTFRRIVLPLAKPGLIAGSIARSPVSRSATG